MADERAVNWQGRALHGLRLGARQPLLQFAVLGGLLFLALGRQDGEPAEAIVVDAALRDRLAQQFEAQLGAPPSAGEGAALVEKYIRDELLYREAKRLGLDRDDEIVRRRMVQKMEFLAESAAAPAEAELRAYYDAHRGDFGDPPQASIRQLYFSPDRGGWDAAKARAAAALAAGRERGESIPLQERYQALGAAEAAKLFGDSALAGAIFTAPLGQWGGPYRSGFGWHLLLVEERNDAGAASFEDRREDVARAWAEANRARQLDGVVAELRQRYKVEVAE